MSFVHVNASIFRRGVLMTQNHGCLDSSQVSSEQLADIVASAGDEGYGALVFAIGGPFGHGPAVRTQQRLLH